MRWSTTPRIGCLLFGGATPRSIDDTWAFDGATWVASPIRPVPQQCAGGFFDPPTGRLLLTRGMPDRMSTIALTETWELDGSELNLITSANPGPPYSWPGRAGARRGPAAADRRPADRGGILLLGAGLGIGRVADMPLPLDLAAIGVPGCDLWIGLEPELSSLRHFGAGGSQQFALAIPDLAVFDGLQIALQALVFDSAAPNGFASVSNAGIATIH